MKLNLIKLASQEYYSGGTLEATIEIEPQGLNRQLDVVSLLRGGQVLELGEAGVDHLCVVAAFAEAPAGLDLGHGPHLVNVLGQLVSDVLHERGKLDLVKIKR